MNANDTIKKLIDALPAVTEAEVIEMAEAWENTWFGHDNNNWHSDLWVEACDAMRGYTNGVEPADAWEWGTDYDEAWNAVQDAVLAMAALDNIRGNDEMLELYKTMVKPARTIPVLRDIIDQLDLDV